MAPPVNNTSITTATTHDCYSKVNAELVTVGSLSLVLDRVSLTHPSLLFSHTSTLHKNNALSLVIKTLKKWRWFIFNSLTHADEFRSPMLTNLVDLVIIYFIKWAIWLNIIKSKKQRVWVVMSIIQDSFVCKVSPH